MRRIVVGLVIVLLGWTQASAGAVASAQSTAPALVRYLLASGVYTEMYVEVDGQRVVQQTTGTLSGYVAIAADRDHTLAIYGYQFGADGPVLLRRISPYRLPAASERMSLFASDGSETQPLAASSVPATHAMLRTTLLTRNGGETPTVMFGNTVLGLPGQQVVNPATALVQVRDARGSVRREAYLRAQPGFRYEIIVVPQPEQGADIYDLVIVPVSPSLLVRPTPTLLFEETGHRLEGRLRQGWEATGGLPIVGFPLNDARQERTPEGRLLTQVFERNRLEHHPANAAPYDVLLGRLGDEGLRQLGRDWRREYVSRTAGNGCDSVTVDGRVFAVCEPFRTYYRAHGLEIDGKPGITAAEALALWGLPLTQAQQETNSSGDRVLTQWFERARMEFHPRNPVGQQVLLGRLGADVYALEPLTFDDEDATFQQRSVPGGAGWREAEGGWGGHFWYACTDTQTYAGWTDLPYREGYRWEMFVPGTHANSRRARVTYSTGDMGGGIEVNQKLYSNQWVPLRFDFPPQGIFVNSDTGEGGCTYEVAVDAIRLRPSP